MGALWLEPRKAVLCTSCCRRVSVPSSAFWDPGLALSHPVKGKGNVIWVEMSHLLTIFKFIHSCMHLIRLLINVILSIKCIKLLALFLDLERWKRYGPRQNQLYNLRGPVQSENMGSLVQKLLSVWWQSIQPSTGPTECVHGVTAHIAGWSSTQKNSSSRKDNTYANRDKKLDSSTHQ